MTFSAVDLAAHANTADESSEAQFRGASPIPFRSGNASWNNCWKAAKLLVKPQAPPVVRRNESYPFRSLLKTSSTSRIEFSAQLCKSRAEFLEFGVYEGRDWPRCHGWKIPPQPDIWLPNGNSASGTMGTTAENLADEQPIDQRP